MRRLRAAGAVLIGSTNMDEGALGTEGNNPWFGAIQNPLRQGYSPGGSSGGSAAAIAGGLCIAALGSDTIGSIRIPAAFCGCVGLKPSSGLVSVGGVLPVHSRFDHVGPLVRTVEDLPAMLAVLAGHDPTSSVSFPLQLTPPRAARTPRTLGYGVGLDPDAIDDALIAAYNQGISRFRRSGASLIPIDLRRWDLARLRRAILALCEAQMSREHREHMNSTPDDYSDGLRAFIRYGGKLGPAELTQAETRIANFYREWQTLMQPLDAVILPTVTCTAFPHGARYPHNTADLTSIATATGLPALSLPLPIVAEGLPFGLQIIGRPAGDLDLLQIALDYAGTAAA